MAPAKRPKKKKDLITNVVFGMTLYKHVHVNEQSFFFKDYNKNIKSELFFISFASTNLKILYLGQKSPHV